MTLPGEPRAFRTAAEVLAERTSPEELERRLCDLEQRLDRLERWARGQGHQDCTCECEGCWQ